MILVTVCDYISRYISVLLLYPTSCSNISIPSIDSLPTYLYMVYYTDLSLYTLCTSHLVYSVTQYTIHMSICQSSIP